MKASSKRNHFDVIASKCRPDHHHCVGQVFLSLPTAASGRPHVDDPCHFVVNLQQIAAQRAKAESEKGSAYRARVSVQSTVRANQIQIRLSHDCRSMQLPRDLYKYVRSQIFDLSHAESTDSAVEPDSSLLSWAIAVLLQPKQVAVDIPDIALTKCRKKPKSQKKTTKNKKKKQQKKKKTHGM